MFFNPLEQFEINILIQGFNTRNGFFPIDFSLTNSGFTLMLVACVIFSCFSFALYYGSVISYHWQAIVVASYLFVLNLFINQVKYLTTLSFFPLFYCIFIYILFSNLLGLFPFAFTVTSHILITGFIAFFAFVGLTIRGFYLYKINFLKVYIISGVPTYLLPVLVVIELLSYWIRPLSLSIRLFANMLAGHTLLNIITNFGLACFKKQFFIFFLPIIVILAIAVLEFGVALLQSYVFLNLLVIYFNDSLALHH